jgi:cystathionine beta-synthase
MSETAARKPYPDVLSMIGNTPMVEVTGFDTGPCRLFLKLESQNPGGSIKDRIGLSMIEAAEREGKIKPGGTIIEATAGNTGLGLALVAAQKGYKMKLIIPDKMSQDKIFHLKALGADVTMTRSDVGKGHPEYYQDMAERLEQEIPNSFWVNQFANPANPEAHVKTTGPEIWDQMDHDLDAVVCGVGSGGTISGLGRYFAEVAPHVRMVLADPDGSIVGKAALTGTVPDDVGSWLVEGIGEDFIPPNCDLSLIADAVYVSDTHAFHAARELVAKTGLLGGSSTGTLLAGALAWCRKQTEPKRVVSFVCDTGNKYLSKVYNDAWMVDNGLMTLESHGDLRDLVVRRADRGQLVTCKTSETLATAYGRMRMFDVSQIPVMDENDKLVGLVDESDVMLAAHEGPDPFADPVTEHMVKTLEVVHPNDSLDDLLPLFRADKVVIVMDGDKLFGLITKVDFINHLRRRGR